MNPKVTVLVPTFNHASFIGQMIEGALKQKTTFSYEILIGDDASSDENATIIADYQRRFPDTIRAILHPENLGPKTPRELGGKNNVAFLFKEAKGEYIALCEGDDYWTNQNKLQKQVDFLEENPEFALCHHQLEVVYEDGSPSHFFNDENQAEISFLENLLTDEHWILGTASTVFRNTIQGKFPDWWMKTASGDLGIFILVAQHGKIKFMPETMGAYRKHRGGMTTIHTPQNVVFLENRKQLFQDLKPYFNGKYDSILNKTIMVIEMKIKEINCVF